MFLMGTAALEPMAGTHGAYGGSIIPADDTHSLCRGGGLVGGL
jgi:hypothetical protein